MRKWRRPRGSAGPAEGRQRRRPDFLVVLTAEFGQYMKEDAEEGFFVPEKYHHRCQSNNDK